MGRLLQAARASAAQWERTIVLLASDHGWKLGEHGAWSKHTLFEADTRVPLIVRLPAAAAASAAGGAAAGGGALPRGVVARGVVELVDVMPSLLELAGLKPPALQHAVKCRLRGATAHYPGVLGLAFQAVSRATHSGRATAPLTAQWDMGGCGAAGNRPFRGV